MTEKYETYAYFWISGAFATSKITAVIGISPTETREQGEPMKYMPEKIREESVWEVHSPLPRDEIFMDAHISALLGVIDPKRDVIKTLQSKYETGINCVGYYTNANPGFHMSTELIRKLADWNVSVDFDLYCLCDHEEVESKV